MRVILLSLILVNAPNGLSAATSSLYASRAGQFLTKEMPFKLATPKMVNDLMPLLKGGSPFDKYLYEARNTHFTEPLKGSVNDEFKVQFVLGAITSRLSNDFWDRFEMAESFQNVDDIQFVANNIDDAINAVSKDPQIRTYIDEKIDELLRSNWDQIHKGDFLAISRALSMFRIYGNEYVKMLIPIDIAQTRLLSELASRTIKGVQTVQDIDGSPIPGMSAQEVRSLEMLREKAKAIVPEVELLPRVYGLGAVEIDMAEFNSPFAPKAHTLNKGLMAFQATEEKTLEHGQLITPESIIFTILQAIHYPNSPRQRFELKPGDKFTIQHEFGGDICTIIPPNPNSPTPMFQLKFHRGPTFQKYFPVGLKNPGRTAFLQKLLLAQGIIIMPTSDPGLYIIDAHVHAPNSIQRLSLH